MSSFTVRLHRVLMAPPERVYRAFLDAGALAKWLPPYGFTCHVHELDARVGGRFRMSFTNFSGGGSHSFGGEYLELVPHERLRYTDVFDDPDSLDLQRDPNPHLAFGIGPHFCLGANLARMEVKVVFEELLARLPDIRIDDNAPLDRGDSSLVIALQHLPATFTPGQCPVPH